MANDPVYGDLSKLEPYAARAQVKGNLVASRARYVQQHFGAETIASLAAGLEEPSRSLLLTPPYIASWHPLTHLMAIDRAIAEGPMKGDVSLMRAFGAEIAGYDIPTLYQVLLKLGSPAFILKRVNVNLLGASGPESLPGEDSGLKTTWVGKRNHERERLYYMLLHAMEFTGTPSPQPSSSTLAGGLGKAGNGVRNRFPGRPEGRTPCDPGGAALAETVPDTVSPGPPTQRCTSHWPSIIDAGQRCAQ